MYKIKRVLWVLRSFPTIIMCKLFYGNRTKIYWTEHIEKLVRFTIAQGSGCLDIGYGSHFKRGVQLHISGSGNLKIGHHVCINSNCYIAAQENVIIGDGCEFGQNVIIVDHDHDFRCIGGIKSRKYQTAPVKIGDNVWIGANTVILRGTSIGNNCVVGAGCVISGTYPKNSVIVQKRDETVIQYVEEVKN